MGDGQLNSGLEVLSTRECEDLLEAQQFGRLALVAEGSPEIFPINYALDASGCVLFRTAAGTKLAHAVNRRVVFEVDHIDVGTHTGWSVVVHGVAQHTTAAVPGARELAPWLPDKPFTLRITRGSPDRPAPRPPPGPLGHDPAALGQAGGVGGRLGAPLHAQLGQQVRHVVLHGLLGQVHRLADLAVGLALGDQVEDAPLLRGERRERVRRRRPVCAAAPAPGR